MSTKGKTKVAPKKAVKGSTKKREMVVVNSAQNFWKPVKIGESVEGLFQELEKRTGGKFGAVEMVADEKGKKTKTNVQYCGVIADENTGEITKMPSTKVLNDFFEDLEKDTFVRITWNGLKVKKGMKKGQKNAEYHDYLLEREQK